MAVTLVLDDEDAMILFHLLYNVSSQLGMERNAVGQLRHREDTWPEGLDVPSDIRGTVNSLIKTQELMSSLLYPR